MISVSKLDDEDSSLKVFMDQKLFEKLDKRFRKRTGYPIDVFFIVKKLGNTYRLEFPPDINDELLNILAEEFVKIDKDIILSIDGIRMFKEKQRNGVFTRINKKFIELINKLRRK